jgi:2-keto-4-pentenoate hydratase/2-oxohepta-3-ene-1,7-dioic acid hydratase in catechol pathway
VLRYIPPGTAPGSEPAFGLVLEAIDGIPTRIFNLSKWTRDGGKRPAPTGRKREHLFASEFALARERWDQYRQTAGRGMAADWERYVDVIAPEELPSSICSPVPLPQEALDGESRIVVAVGLNYREHADDAGGGDLFLFPKPVRPTGAYRTLHVGDDVRLLDYELELGFVLLDDVDLTAIPSPSELDGMVAYFVANDVSDREPIIKRSGTSGPGTGFVEGKGKPGFMPLGPWMVHGDDLRFLSDDCARSLHMRLSIRESGRVSLRQEAATDAMIAGPREILETLAEKVDVTEPGGNRTEMSVTLDGRERFYPLALVKDGKPILPKGSIVLTGTPGGTALEAPSRFSLVMRAMVRFQSPRTRFLEDQVETRDAEGYLGEGDVVIGDIEELGTQWWQVRWNGASQPDLCGDALRAVP